MADLEPRPRPRSKLSMGVRGKAWKPEEALASLTSQQESQPEDTLKSCLFLFLFAMG